MPSASDLGAYAGVLALLGLVSHRAAADRRGTPNPFRRPVYAFLLLAAASVAVLAPTSVRVLTGAGLGETGLIAAGDALRAAAAGCLVGVARAIDGPTPGSPARRRLGAAAVQLVMAEFFIAAHPGVAADGTLTVDGPGRWTLAAHDAVFAAYVLWCLSVLFPALLPQARDPLSPRPLRIAVRLSLAAVIVGAAWTLWTVDDILAVARDGTQGGSDDWLSNLLGATSVSLLLAAGTVRRWGGPAARPLRWWRTRRRYRTLGPLWSALRAELPEIALDTRELAGAGLTLRLYRREIEIHDARLALRPFRADAGVAGSARAEAAAIAAALGRLRAAERGGLDGTGGGVCGGAGGGVAAGENATAHADDAVDHDPTADPEWLTAVAREFRRRAGTRQASADEPGSDRS